MIYWGFELAGVRANRELSALGDGKGGGVPLHQWHISDKLLLLCRNYVQEYNASFLILANIKVMKILLGTVLK